MILFQCPQATLVNSFKRWQELGRQVRAGEKGIRILAPRPFTVKTGKVDADGNEEERSGMGFVEVSVFDLSQTDGEELRHYRPNLDNTEEVYAASLTFAEAEGYKVREDPVLSAGGSVTGGYIREGGITINTLTPQGSRVLTLWHELGHGILEHTKGNDLAKNLREGEAEVVEAVVAAHFGFDVIDASASYLRNWNVKPADVKRSLERVKKAAGLIIEGVEKVLLEEAAQEEETLPVAVGQ